MPRPPPRHGPPRPRAPRDTATPRHIARLLRGIREREYLSDASSSLLLPHGAGHVVVVVFVKESEAEAPRRERVIAEIARAVHDYFLFRGVAQE